MALSMNSTDGAWPPQPGGKGIRLSVSGGRFNRLEDSDLPSAMEPAQPRGGLG